MISLTKAYIVSQNGTKYKVRIPIYHGIEGSSNATPAEELPYATVSATKGTVNPYIKGDIVYVSFEDNDLSKPVIVGGLLLNGKVDTTLDMYIDALTVNNKAILPASTSIGDITSENINSLKNIRTNIQKQFDNILECDSVYTAKYLTSDYSMSTTWILEDKGLVLTSELVDEDSEAIVNTYDYTRATTQTGDKTFQGNNVTLLQSDGYDKDYRQRLNWQGVNVVKNDTVKMSYGLYARNHWNLTQGDGNLAQPEYTYRPTIQSYTSREELSQGNIVTEEDNVKTIHTGYFPYSMQINPDGGDVYFGRSGVVSVIDHHDPAWAQAANVEGTQKQGLQVGKVMLFTDRNNNLMQQDTTTGVAKPVGSGNGSAGGGVGTNFFVFADAYFLPNASTSGIIHTLDSQFTYNGTIYRISLDGSKLNKLVNNAVSETYEMTYLGVITYNGDSFRKYRVVVGSNTHNVYHRSYAAPYVKWYDPLTPATYVNERRLSLEGLYTMYADKDETTQSLTYNETKVLAGFVDLSIEIVLQTFIQAGLFTNNRFQAKEGIITWTLNSVGNGTATFQGISHPVIGYAFNMEYAGEHNLYVIQHDAGSSSAGVLLQSYGNIPVTASARVQLGSLKAMSVFGDTGLHMPIRMNLQATTGLGWENRLFNFMIDVEPHFPTSVSSGLFDDIISIDIRNVDNFISTIDLSSDTIVNLSKGRLTSTVNGVKTPAIINVSASYSGVDISGVYLSTVTPISDESIKESI